jgi:hypothetical protein
MKKCPQCNNVFADDNKYCLNDGTLLIEENLPMPSEIEIGEEPTQIRTEPIIVDIAQEIPPTVENPPVQETIIVHRPPEEKRSKTPKYIVFLLLGLLIGGGLVLGTFLLAGKFYQNQNSNVDYTNVNLSVKNTENVGAKSDKTISDNSDGFNGRVIAINANLRSEPGLYSDEIAVLPIDEKINIIRRENDSSPWYYVEAENGESGWIHGNTIEFTRP